MTFTCDKCEPPCVLSIDDTGIVIPDKCPFGIEDSPKWTIAEPREVDDNDDDYRDRGLSAARRNR